MKTKVYSIPQKMDTHWLPEVKAILDTVHSYALSLSEFKTAVIEKGLTHSKTFSGRAWIVDSSEAQGVFSPDIQNFIGSDVFPSFANNGIKYFITIPPQKDTLAKITVKRFSDKAGPNGLKLVEASSLEVALDFLKKTHE